MYIFILYSILLSFVYSKELKDELYNIHDDKNLLSVIKFFDENPENIIYIDYFSPFPKYQRVKRDNYFGYHNNCIESRFYFDYKDEKEYEVYFDRKSCDGSIKMIVDKRRDKHIILKK